MPSKAETQPVDISELSGPARDFAAYCETELERRRNSEAEFDVGLYDQAVRLVLQKLGAFDVEGQA